MITIINPKDIAKDKELIAYFKTKGMDYLDINCWIGWNYVIDHVWLYSKMKKYLEKNKLKDPIIFDIGCGNSPFHSAVEERLGIKIIGLDRPTGYCHQEGVTNADYFVEFLDFDKFTPKSVDIIYWLSAIEHNQKNMIEKLYKKSVEFLKPGGLLLITFPISKRTYWFENSQQTNLSIEDAKLVFNDEKVIGNFNKVHSEFRANVLNLKNRYKKRYSQFDRYDPEFLVGGLEQII